MVRCYIGLGSNIGDRVDYLHKARAFVNAHHDLRIIAESPLYQTAALLPEGAPKAWDIPYLNQVIAVETSLAPHDVLAVLKGAELHLGRQLRGHWAPREIDCDVLLHGETVLETESLTLPHPRMINRRFVLKPLCDIAPDVKIRGKSAQQWLDACEDSACARYRPLPPALVGVLNITPDSFSDGGAYATVDSAVSHCAHLVSQRVSVVDVGAESTRPGASTLTHEEEWSRLAPVLEGICAHFANRSFALSVDSYHPETVQKALALGVDWVNDVTGFTNQAMCDVAYNSNVQLVAMHSLCVPANPDYVLPAECDVVLMLARWAESLLSGIVKQGVSLDRVILDPGLGFGKTAAQSLQLVMSAHQLVAWFPDVRWLFGHSRKSYQRLMGAELASEREMVTLAHSLQLAQAGVHFLRVHNVAAHHALFAQTGLYGAYES